LTSATSASLRSFERLRSSLPEAVQQPDTYSPDPATRRPSWGAPLPGCRLLRARHPLASPLPREMRGGAINSARSHKAQARRLEGRELLPPTVLEVCCTDRFLRGLS
jgi:hypothetical protein